MRVSAICKFEQSSKNLKQNSANKKANTCRIDTSQIQDTVEFRGKNAVKGAGIGFLLGVGALSVMTGGAAAPIAYALYAGATGVAGGMLGHVVDKTDKDNED